jgi:hypothetical protein
MEPDNFLPAPPEEGTPTVISTHPMEDLAYHFVEEEVGRHDWERNWETICKRENPVDKVDKWLKSYGVKDGDANWITDHITQLTKTHHGARWK